MSTLKNNWALIAFRISLCLLGVFGLSAVFNDGVYAAKPPAQPSAQAIGFVDYSYLIDNHPDTPKANQALQAERDQARKEYLEKSVVLNEKGKQDLESILNQRVEQKRLELLKPIIEKINTAIKAVADSKGMSMVVYKNTVAYGGVDITEEVLKQLKK